MNFLFDTCVIVDVLQNRTPFCFDAQKLFLFVADNSIIGYISAKSITDIYYLTHRITHSDADARTIIIKLLSIFTIVDTTGIDCSRALISSVSDYEDAVMIETARRINVDGIITRNIKDYKNSDIKIYTPKEVADMNFSDGRNRDNV